MFCRSNKIDVETYLNKNKFYEEKIDPDRYIAQGNIFIPYQTLTLKKDSEAKLNGYEAKNILGIIIVTNQCDIEQNKAKFITYAPIFRALDVLTFFNNQEREVLSTIMLQNHRNTFYLPPHPYIDNTLGGLILFENLLSVKIEVFKKKYTSPKLHLKRPFIDKLCSNIAYLFNRVPIINPKKDKVEEWIDKNELIQNFIQNFIDLVKLQQKTSRYISSEEMQNLFRKNRDFEECKKILELYGKGSKFFKTKDAPELKKVINELEQLEDSKEGRFLKLKEDYKKLSQG